jgi:hypothetical protein
MVDAKRIKFYNYSILRILHLEQAAVARARRLETCCKVQNTEGGVPKKDFSF